MYQLANPMTKWGKGVKKASARGCGGMVSAQRYPQSDDRSVDARTIPAGALSYHTIRTTLSKKEMR